jgi:two-component system response regulator (stage 0 sporulation protein F)
MTHVLLAEDDHEVRWLLAAALRQQGYQITEADSGPKLLEQLWKRAASKSSFDLIISDIRLPGMTGLEVLQALRTRADPRDEYRPQIHETPIILITAFGDAEVHRGAARLGSTTSAPARSASSRPTPTSSTTRSRTRTTMMEAAIERERSAR